MGIDINRMTVGDVRKFIHNYRQFLEHASPALDAAVTLLRMGDDHDLANKLQDMSDGFRAMKAEMKDLRKETLMNNLSTVEMLLSAINGDPDPK